MAGIASTVLTIVFILAASLSLIYLLYLLAREKGALHAILGFIFPLYPYVWGWLNAARLQIIDIMFFWTFATLGSVAFPLIMAAVSAPTVIAGTGTIQSVGIGADVNRKGPITSAGQVQGQINDMFGVDEWTYAATAGQIINLRADPARGSQADPRLTVLDPAGLEIASDDDSGGNFSAAITGLELDRSGTYRIQVDVWSPGAYTLRLDQ